MTVSVGFRQAVYSPETGRFYIHLITISHPDLAEDILISTDPTGRLEGEGYTTDAQVVYGTVSRGKKYVFFPVKLKLPDDTPEGLGEMQIEIDNIHRQYIETIRTLSSPPMFNVEIVLDNDLDEIEGQWPEFELRNVTYDAFVITGTLKMESYVTEPFPAADITPSHFPGSF